MCVCVCVKIHKCAHTDNVIKGRPLLTSVPGYNECVYILPLTPFLLYALAVERGGKKK